MNSKILSDEQIVEKVRNGDKDLYSQILSRYQDKLNRYVLYLTNNDLLATDIVQEAFIKAYINLHSFNIVKKFSSWLYRIAHNEAMNSLKKYKKEVPILPNIDYRSSRNIEDEMEKEEVVAMAHKCLDNLPIKYSEPLILYYLEDKSYDEISDILRLPIGTVGTRINRAKNLMKHICQNIK